MPDLGTIGTLAGSLGISAIVGAVVNAYANRKKLGADATKVITEAASEVVGNARDDAKAAREETVKLRNQIAVLEAREDARDDREDQWRELLILHDEWDREVIALLREKYPDAKLPPRPALMLPRVVRPQD